ncbi:MAG: hypothetical protein HQM08_07845 [Candidatus Riflebacteria bacterium]|nr:hypothetical protein [Candidatus Riflebacteria bacterium]
MKIVKICVPLFLVFSLLATGATYAEDCKFAINADTPEFIRNASSTNPKFPVNNELLKVFDDIVVPSGDINTQVRYLWRNDNAWYARWKMVEMAKQSIDCTYYILDSDIFGQAFLGALAKKAQEGVKVRLMVDWRIAESSYMKGMINKLQDVTKDPNIEIRLYNSAVKSWEQIFTDYRKLVASNHDKILIIDGKISMTGGRNIGSDYFAGKGEEDCVYRDSDILMGGTHAAGQMKQAFEDEWACMKNVIVHKGILNFCDQRDKLELARQAMDKYLKTGQIFNPNSKEYSEPMKTALADMNEELVKYRGLSQYNKFDLWHGERCRPVKIIDKHSRLGPLNDITPTLIKFMDNCKYEILMQNPYVVLTPDAEAALARASARGVKIVFHSNSGGSTDSLFPQAFLMNDLPRYLKEMPTAKFYAAPTPAQRLHSKVFVFDSQIAVIGTYNLDPLSEEVNSEVVAAVKDPTFATMTRLRLYNDMKVVVEYKVEVQKDGTVKSVFGPENHLTPEVIEKMNKYRKLGLIRPTI